MLQTRPQKAAALQGSNSLAPSQPQQLHKCLAVGGGVGGDVLPDVHGFVQMCIHVHSCS